MKKVKLGLRSTKSGLLRWKIMDHFDKDPVRTLLTLEKTLPVKHKHFIRSFLLQKFKEREMIHRAVVNVMKEFEKEHPHSLTWTIRKSLNPGFRIGESVYFIDKGEPIKGKIVSMGSLGASIRSIKNPGIVYTISGERIEKLSSIPLAS